MGCIDDAQESKEGVREILKQSYSYDSLNESTPIIFTPGNGCSIDKVGWYIAMDQLETDKEIEEYGNGY